MSIIESIVRGAHKKLQKKPNYILYGRKEPNNAAIDDDDDNNARHAIKHEHNTHHSEERNTRSETIPSVHVCACVSMCVHATEKRDSNYLYK